MERHYQPSTAKKQSTSVSSFLSSLDEATSFQDDKLPPEQARSRREFWYVSIGTNEQIGHTENMPKVSQIDS